MSIQPHRSEYSQSHAELELVQALFEQSQTSYPWNPLDPATENYFAALEQEFSLADWSVDEVAHKSQNFFSQLNQVWIQNSLIQKFAARVPQHLLQAIAHQAQQIVSTNLSLAEQLVQCVRDALPNWGEDDLQVLARPLAYAMRGIDTEGMESTLGALRPADWTELSEVEQARLSLAVARYALAQLQSNADHIDS